jgi:hypothetical protein
MLFLCCNFLFNLCKVQPMQSSTNAKFNFCKWPAAKEFSFLWHCVVWYICIVEPAWRNRKARPYAIKMWIIRSGSLGIEIAFPLPFVRKRQVLLLTSVFVQLGKQVSFFLVTVVVKKKNKKKKKGTWTLRLCFLHEAMIAVLTVPCSCPCTKLWLLCWLCPVGVHAQSYDCCVDCAL